MQKKRVLDMSSLYTKNVLYSDIKRLHQQQDQLKKFHTGQQINKNEGPPHVHN